MTITKLKTKNQLTIPNEIVKKMNLKQNEFFLVEVERNYIKLMPVNIEPRYDERDIKAIDNIIGKEKSKGKAIPAGKEFSQYIKKLAK